MGITEPYDAYCLDEAVYAFGVAVRNEVDEARQPRSKQDTEKMRAGRAQLAFDRMLGNKPKFAMPSQRPVKASEVQTSG